MCLMFVTHANITYRVSVGRMESEAAVNASWFALLRDMKRLKKNKVISAKEFQAFSMHVVDVDINQVTRYDARTFPNRRIWRDQNNFLYYRRGLAVFDYRGRQGNNIPDPDLTLAFTYKTKRLKLICSLVSAIPNTITAIDEAIAVGNSDRHFSTVCGRATLKLNKYEFETKRYKSSLERDIDKAPRHRCLEDI